MSGDSDGTVYDLPDWMKDTFVAEAATTHSEVDTPTYYPTYAPTVTPTYSPTYFPTESPTAAPVPEPTLTKLSNNGPTSTIINQAGSSGTDSYVFETTTRSPSVSPTIFALNQPTLNAQTSIPNETFAPSISVTATEQPTQTASETMQPTASVTFSLTIQPSKQDTIYEEDARCRTEFGFFGAAAGDQTILTFAYELETIPTVLPAEVISDIEESLVNSVLPVVFPSQCGEDGNQGGDERHLRNLLILGVSSVPDDEITACKLLS